MNTALKNIRALFEPLETACVSACKIIDQKVIAYNNRIEETRRIEEEKLTARVEKGTLKPETAARKMETIPTADRHVTNETGSLTITKLKRFRITDISKVPIEYMLPNETAIRKAMHEGKDIPGVEYFIENSVSGR